MYITSAKVMNGQATRIANRAAQAPRLAVAARLGADFRRRCSRTDRGLTVTAAARRLALQSMPIAPVKQPLSTGLADHLLVSGFLRALSAADIANLRNHGPSERKLLGGIWIDNETSAFVEGNRAPVGGKNPKTDALIAIRPKLMQRCEPQSTAGSCRPVLRFYVDGPDFRVVRRRTLIATWANRYEARDLAAGASNKKAGRTLLDRASPHRRALAHREGPKIGRREDAVVRTPPGRHLHLGDAAAIGVRGKLDEHDGDRQIDRRPQASEASCRTPVLNARLGVIGYCVQVGSQRRTRALRYERAKGRRQKAQERNPRQPQRPQGGRRPVPSWRNCTMGLST